MSVSDLINGLIFMFCLFLLIKVGKSVWGWMWTINRTIVLSQYERETNAAQRVYIDQITDLNERLERAERARNDAISDLASTADRMAIVSREMERPPTFYSILAPARLADWPNIEPTTVDDVIEHDEACEVTVDLHNTHPFSTIMVRQEDIVIVHAIDVAGEHFFWHYCLEHHYPLRDDQTSYAVEMPAWMLCALAINTNIRVGFLNQEDYEWHTSIAPGLGEDDALTRPRRDNYVMWGAEIPAPDLLQPSAKPSAPPPKTGRRVIRPPRK